MIHDYVIVGAGSAGCILADRLSACGRFSVLLIEAGGEASGFWFRLPVGYMKAYFNPKTNWMLHSSPQEALDGRSLYAPRGKVVGGSGSINAMIYVRGLASDFNGWRAAGNPGWGFDEVLPYFKRLESVPHGDPHWRGQEGRIGISSMRADAHAICADYLNACQELGLPMTNDFNGEHMEGGGIYEANIRSGVRSSSAAEYLRPARQRRNLTVLTHTQVEKILWDENGRATGVQWQQGGVTQTAHARCEVVLSAGAVASPQLLQLSGVGDGALLQSLGIAVQHHLPGVGQHLQDHLCASYYFKANRPTLNNELGSIWGQFKAGLRYAVSRRGPLAMSVNQAGGFFRGETSLAEPNLQLYFNPLSYSIPSDTQARLKPDPYPGFLIAFNACRPSSRGRVEIRSSDVTIPPLIQPNYLSTAQDQDEALQGSRMVRRLAATKALRSITVEEVLPGPAVASDAAMLAYFKTHCGSIYHLCGSCAMGDEASQAVVDARLRVHGRQGLRVVDASVFPQITSGNINAPTMMVAEKAADMILADWA